MDATEQAALMARGHVLLRTGAHGEALAAGRALEAAMPADEAGWRALHAYYTALGSSAWADIMTGRFLQTEPDNVPARMARAVFLGNSPTRHGEAEAALIDLLRLDITTAPHWQTMGDMYERFGLGGRLFEALDRTLSADPGNVPVRSMIAAHCITHRNLARAKAEIVAMRDLARGNVGTLFAAMQLAQRMGHDAFVDETLAQAMALAPAGQHGPRGWLILIAAKSRRTDILAALMADTDFSALDTVAQVVAVLQAIEGRGFIMQERALVARGLALDPGHAALAAAARRLDTPLAGQLMGLQQKPAAARLDPGRRSLRERVRTLRFWRAP